MQLASATPTSLTFGTMQVGTTSASQAVTLTNTGLIPLSFTSATIGGINPANFAQTNTCPAVLAVGASCTIDVTFKPNATGTRSATLSLNDGAGTQTVALSGAGI